MSSSQQHAMRVLQLRAVRVERGGQPVLAGIDLSLAATERVSIEGATGSGKSSLLWAVLGLIPSAGSIEILGHACRTERDFTKVRGPAALLFQDSDEQLIGPSVLDDVLFGPLNLGVSAKVSRQRAQEALSQLGLNDLSHRTVRSLSGGQKRLVALAGVLSMRPELLLLDEPTAGLDSDTAQVIIDVLVGLQRPMLVVSHEPRCIAALATRRCLLRDGRLVPHADEV